MDTNQRVSTLMKDIIEKISQMGDEGLFIYIAVRDPESGYFECLSNVGGKSSLDALKDFVNSASEITPHQD